MDKPVQQLSRTIFRNSVVGLAAQFAIRALSFSFTVFIVRNLGAETYGQYAAVLAFGAVFIFLSDLGLGPYAVREIARFRDDPDGTDKINQLYGNILTLRFLLSIVTAALLIFSAWLTGRPPVMIGAIALGTVGLIMYSAQGTSDAMLAGLERLDLSSGARVLQQLAFVLAGALALWLRIGYYGLIAANLLGVALLTIVCLKIVRRLGIHPRRAVLRVWPSLLRASVPFGTIGFTLGLSYKFDSVLLNIFRGDAETGYYNAAYNLVFAAIVLSNVINTTLYPSLARQAYLGLRSLTDVYARVLRYLMLVALPAAVGLWILADQLVPLLYKSSYLPAITALEILAWVIPLMYLSEFLGYVVIIRGDEGRVARAVVVSTGLNVAMNLLLVPRFGLVGAAVMTVLTEVILVGQYLWLLRDLMRQLNWGMVFLRPMAATAVMGLLVYTFRELPLPARVALGAGSYALLVLALRIVGSDELAFLRSMRRPPATVSVVTATPTGR